LHRLAGCFWFSHLDVKSAFHQIPLDECCQVYTTFPHRGFLYRWSRLVEGLKPASGFAQAVFSQVLGLKDEPGSWLHTDDILLFHVTWQEHLDCLERILRRAARSGLVFGISKCGFLLQMVEWLGRYISRGVIHPPYDYIGKVLDRPRPMTVGAVRSWTAAVGWIIEHLPGAPTLMAPIHAIMHVDTLKKAGVRVRGGKVAKATPVHWTEDAMAAFEEVRRLCSSPATLQIPDANGEFAIQCDGSGIGWGAVLMQRAVDHPAPVEERPWRPVSFAGGKWKSLRQASSCARSLELSAMRNALVHWSYLVKNGKAIRVYTDHHSLAAKVEPLPQDAGWLRNVVGDILNYPLAIASVKGVDMGIPDVISRHPPC